MAFQTATSGLLWVESFIIASEPFLRIKTIRAPGHLARNENDAFLRSHRWSISAEPPRDARFVQVVRRHFHFHTVADGNSDPALAHLAANGCEHHVLVPQLDAEHRARKHHRDDA